MRWIIGIAAVVLIAVAIASGLAQAELRFVMALGELVWAIVMLPVRLMFAAV
jgi:hypothetical protein